MSARLRAYRETVDELRRAGWLVDTVEVTGLGGARATVDVSQEAPAGGDHEPGGSRLPGGLTGDGGDSLWVLSHETGGTFYDNRGRFEKVTADLLADTSYAYYIVFRTPELLADSYQDDSYHEIEVRLREGSAPSRARVITRRGYEVAHRSTSESTAWSWLSNSDRFWDRPDVSGLPVRALTVAAATSTGRTRFVFVVDVDLDRWPSGAAGRESSLVAQAVSLRGRRGRANGSIIDLVVDSVPIMERATSQARRRQVVIGDLEGGGPDGRIGLRVVDTSGIGEFRKTIEMANTTSIRGALSGFFLFDPATVEIRVEPGFDLEDPDSSPFAFAGGLWLPAPDPIFARGTTASVLARFSGADALFDQLAGAVVGTGTGKSISVALTVVDERAISSNDRVLFLHLATDALPLGEYRLLIGRSRPAGDSVASLVLPFTVR